MIVRKMEEKDLEAVSAICLASFIQSVAATLSEEGVSTFSKIAAVDSFCERMQGDNLMLVAEIDSKTVGVIELKEGRHVAMLFVSPDYQKKGVGRKLLSAALECARNPIVTVSASLSSIPAYEKYGFECKGSTAESAGLIYQPMEIELNKSLSPAGTCCHGRSM